MKTLAKLEPLAWLAAIALVPMLAVGERPPPAAGAAGAAGRQGACSRCHAARDPSHSPLVRTP